VIILGYVLGEKLKGSIDKYLLPIVAVVIVISILPLLFGFIKERKNKA
jgi:membrane-associated protein